MHGLAPGDCPEIGKYPSLKGEQSVACPDELQRIGLSIPRCATHEQPPSYQHLRHHLQRKYQLCAQDREKYAPNATLLHGFRTETVFPRA